MALPSQTPSLPTPPPIQQNNENWFRIALLVYEAILPAIISVIHNDCNDPTYQGLPRNDTDLYKELNARRSKINQMKKDKLIDQHQYDILLPSSGKTDSTAFDMSLAYAVIRNLFKFRTGTGWNYATLLKQKSMEISIPAYVLRGKELRNFLCHSNPAIVDQKTLDDKWKEGFDVVNGLKYNCDLNSLMNRPLDGKTFESLKNRLDTESKQLRDEITSLKDKIHDLQNNDQSCNKRMDEIEDRIDEKERCMVNISEKLNLVSESVVERMHERNVMKESIDEIINSMYGLRKDVNRMKNVKTSQDESVCDESPIVGFGTKIRSDQDVLVAWMSGGNCFYALDINQDFEEVTKEELYELQRETNQWSLVPYGEDIKKKDFSLGGGRVRVSVLKGLEIRRKRQNVYKIVVVMKKETNLEVQLELNTNEIKNHLLLKNGSFTVHTYGTFETRKRVFEKSDNKDDDEVSEDIVLNCGESEKISRNFQWYRFILQKGYDFLTDSIDQSDDTVSCDQAFETTKSHIISEEKEVESEEAEESDTEKSDTEGWFSCNSECESSSEERYGSGNESSDEEESIDRRNWEKQVLDNWKRCYTLRSHVVGSQCDNYSVQRMISFISEKYRKHGVFVFPGYCVKKHDAFLSGRPIGEESGEEYFKNILVFIPVHRLILLIKVMETNASLFDIYSELDAHNEEIKVFIRRHSCHFIEEQYSIFPLILLPHARFGGCPKLLKNHYPFCKKLRKRIFLQEDLSNMYMISQKWEHLIQNIRQRSLDSASSTCRDGWKTFLSHVIGYMSTTNFFLPNPRDDTSVAVKKIFLTHRQHHALLDDENHMLITGSFGTGKSIMCQLKLVRLVQTLDQSHTIHFISFNQSSLLIKYLKNVVQHLRKCNENEKRSNHPNVITKNLASNKIAEYLKEEILDKSLKGHTHHFIGDEFDPEFLTMAEAYKINSILSLIKSKTKSVVSVSVIPLLKRRKRNDPNGAVAVVINDGYQLEKLDMKEWKLDKVFRITKEVYELMKATVEVIENNPTQFTLKEEENNKETASDVAPSYEADGTSDQRNAVEETVDHSIEADEEVQNSKDRNQEMDTSNRSNRSDQDLDYLFKLAQRSHEAEQGVMIETSFSFEKCDIDTYHRTIGQKPNLVTLFDDSESRSSNIFCDESFFKKLVFKVYVALIKIVRIEDDQSTVMICTSLNEVAVCKAALEIAKQRNNCWYHIYLPTLSPSMNSSENNKGGIIVTDVDGVTGLEFWNVVIPVTESEHFMAFNLVQSLTRSLSHVHFFRFPSENVDSGRAPVAGQVIASWRKKKLIKEVFVKQCELCETNEDNLCSCGEKRKDEHLAVFACQHYFDEIESVINIPLGQSKNGDSSLDIASSSSSIRQVLRHQQEQLEQDKQLQRQIEQMEKANIRIKQELREERYIREQLAQKMQQQQEQPYLREQRQQRFAQELKQIGERLKQLQMEQQQQQLKQQLEQQKQESERNE